ncbi:hypothetical protein IDM40_25470 [Nocardiopsis sp. HNM0947]|uniref:Uncharacterized protein n=1 Tax=Nocardiopsis coralli TaxID=2772213 RepID=A0ABR9PDT8_9ACTN|nr:hypothetical protein [Nocardiopsis coralli]MBE3002021.1 hypothetical protein [Nocardiopsis coralli]
MRAREHPRPPGHSTLEELGLAGPPTPPPPSEQAFPDGGAWRVEIPSVEGPTALETVFAAADGLAVPVHRVSQGSGVGMLTDAEITAMVDLCRNRGAELCLFLRPGADWDTGAGRTAATGSVASRSRGAGQLAAGVTQAERAAALGVDSLLVADEGLLWTLHRMRTRGDLPEEVRFKVSATAAPANPAAFRVQELLGADTVNAPPDLAVHQLAELRAVGTAPLDVYVESPDDTGGFVRHHEIAGIVRACAPVYVKFGLRNAPGLYPAGEQLAPAVAATARERVRRAQLGLDELARTEGVPAMSPVGSHGLTAPERFALPDRKG